MKNINGSGVLEFLQEIINKNVREDHTFLVKVKEKEYCSNGEYSLNETTSICSEVYLNEHFSELLIYPESEFKFEASDVKIMVKAYVVGTNMSITKSVQIYL